MLVPALREIHETVSISPRRSILARFPPFPSKSSPKSIQHKLSKSQQPTRRHQLPIPARPSEPVWEDTLRLSDINGRWSEGRVLRVWHDLRRRCPTIA